MSAGAVGSEHKVVAETLAATVRVRIVQSLLRGDDRCRFAIELPGDL
jgi:predicted ArsR family transcriptional regulator